MPYASKTYRQFRFIGLRSKSYTFEKPGTVPEPSFGRGDDYLPVPFAMMPDARTRLERFAHIVDLARKEALAAHPPVLNILVAPEFYFRPETPRYYDEANGRAVIDAIHTMFAHQLFEHWLIVAGTVVWNQPRRARDITLIDRVRNTLVVVKGGDPEAPYLEADKINYSSADAIPEEVRPGSHPTLGHLVGTVRERRKFLFECDGLRFGFEICRDHATDLHTLKSTRRGIGWNTGDAPRNPFDLELARHLDFHVVVAAGMDIRPTSVAADQGRYVLRTDGVGKVELRRVTQQVPSDVVIVDDILSKTTIGPSEQRDAVQNLSPRTQVTGADYVTPVVLRLPERIAWKSDDELHIYPVLDI